MNTRGGKHTNKNLSKRLDEIMKLKEGTEREYKKSLNDYPTISIKIAEQLATQLEKQLDRAAQEGEDKIDIADNIYKILLDSNLFKKLEDAKDRFDFYQDLYDRFNS